MVEKRYRWEDGATLEEHSRRKHKILREYFARYLEVRCRLPQQSRFRLAIVEGFAGGGRYQCGSPGSPVIFVEELQAAVSAFNIRRAADGMSPLDIECLLVLNDEDDRAFKSLQQNLQPVLATAKEQFPRLHLHPEFRNLPFEAVYPEAKELLARGAYRNVIFNLDQCGHSHINRSTLIDIMRSYSSAEIFYTFAIQALLAFLRQNNPTLLASQLRYLDVKSEDISVLEGLMNKQTWLGAAERLVFNFFGDCAPFVSPFSINNQDGWRYWLIHFANSYRARQVYNDVLHKNSSMQAHFGRPGLDMLSYDPSNDANSLFLFDVSGREESKRQLLEDIPRLVSEFGDVVNVGEFYQSIYKLTPAHTNDIHQAIIENPDMEVRTDTGGERRSPNTITSQDILRLKLQRSFFPMFLDKKNNE